MMSVAGVGAAQAINMIERAHQMYRDGQHEEALDLYTEALSMAKSKPQKIALHSNRAACYLKLQDFKKAAEECTLVLELDHKHTGALMLRAQTLVTLKEYNSALFDVNRLMELNPSSDVYQSLQARLKTQLSLAPIPECDEEYFVSELEDDYDDERVEEIPAIAGTVKKAEGARSIPNPEDPASQTESFKDVANTHSEESEAILTAKLHTNPVVFAEEKVEATRLSSADACAFSQTERFKDLAVVHYKGREISQAQSISAQKTEIAGTIPNPEAPVYQKQKLHISSTVHSKGSEATTQKQIMHSKLMADHKAKLTGTVANAASEKQQSSKDLPDIQSKAWEAIPKPKGHSNLDYSRWNRVEDDSSDDEEDEEEESLPQYRFRVKTVGVRPVK